MYDGWKIIVGLIVCLAFFTFPFFYDAGKAAKAPEPVLTPKAKEAKECVAPGAYMKRYHMQLLEDWRNTAVRGGERYYDTGNPTWHLRVMDKIADATASAGERLYKSVERKVYYKSLQVTCMDCHSNKSKFCDQCHNYMGIAPYCWECHIEPEEKK
ncbi:MAG: cytochrome C [Deltaproteobacteria bacterium]|mgnify:CR=1 FL=1|nr:MAG: cytochrome C [Deltaproteobacteria bacterium]